MAQTQIADIIQPVEFLEYTLVNSVVSTAFYESGVAVQNGVIAEQLAAGAEFFNAPSWLDLGEAEADVTSDDPTVMSTPQKFSTINQIVRKSFLHQSWSAMSLASELSGSNPLTALQSRVTNYWDRQFERRLVASLNGVLASNITNNAGDMVVDITGTGAPGFGAIPVINAMGTLGDRLNDVKAIAMHSSVYQEALKNDLIEFIPQSNGVPIRTFRGLAVIIDDALVYSSIAGVTKYTTILFAQGAVSYGFTAPRVGPGIEVYRLPQAGNGGGQETLHSRYNVAIAPHGMSWSDSSGGNALAGVSPTLADLANGAHWTRVVPSRKSVPIAFLITL